MQFFGDGDGIDNVTLWLWKFSDFCPWQTVAVAGDDTMYHILVCDMLLEVQFLANVYPNIFFHLSLF